MRSKIIWPDNHSFAFTVFDDPDSQTMEASRAVYGFLADCGLRTTKGVWPVLGHGIPSDHGLTCADAEYLRWLKQLQASGFEIGYHNATSHTSVREETILGLDAFAAQFGHHPNSMANHYFCEEGIYWGENRLSGVNRLIYSILTRGKNRGISFGHVPEHPLFWGDLCKERIQYVRNFVFADINTLNACPHMPYYDPARPYVNYWYASSEGAQAPSFIERINAANQDRLEHEGGACIMYTHFGMGFYKDGQLNAQFQSLIRRLSRKNGWFVPVSTLLDFLKKQNSSDTITNAQRASMERRWLKDKVLIGTA